MNAIQPTRLMGAKMAMRERAGFASRRLKYFEREESVVSSAYGFLFSSTTSGDGETDDDKNRNVQHSLSERLH